MIRATNQYYNGQSSLRLNFRKLELKDIGNWIDFLKDESSIKHFSEEMKTGDGRSDEWIEKQLLRHKDLTFGLLAVEEKNTARFIGQAGLITQEMNGKEELEIGYHLLPEFRKMGYATESAIFFRKYARANTNVSSVISIIHPENESSKRVARKNGMKSVKENKFNGLNVEIFRFDINR